MSRDIDKEPFPKGMTTVLEVVGDLGLIGGMLVGIGTIIESFADRAAHDSYNVMTGIIIGLAVCFAGAFVWALLRAVSLGLTYLWRAQRATG